MKLESKYDIGKQWTQGLLAGLTPSPYVETESAHWKAGYDFGYKSRKEWKHNALNEYLVSIGQEPMGYVYLQ
jgi:hypothetical protein